MAGEFCAVSPKGDEITIALSERSGAPREITLSFDEASALSMTLPRLLTKAIGLQFSDPSLRHVYPVQGYVVEEASDQRHLLVSLSSDDGFAITFALGVEMIPSLACALSNGPALLDTPKPRLRN